mmetsp:Transcript_19648/g.44860  ORF Transcript_19648/g.44860 Transcript_19648/m.44860 type:complete len:662 (-) Transcript_19648:8-1993(-)
MGRGAGKTGGRRGILFRRRGDENHPDGTERRRHDHGRGTGPVEGFLSETEERGKVQAGKDRGQPPGPESLRIRQRLPSRCLGFYRAGLQGQDTAWTPARSGYRQGNGRQVGRKGRRHQGPAAGRGFFCLPRHVPPEAHRDLAEQDEGRGHPRNRRSIRHSAFRRARLRTRSGQLPALSRPLRKGLGQHHGPRCLHRADAKEGAGHGMGRRRKGPLGRRGRNPDGPSRLEVFGGPAHDDRIVPCRSPPRESSKDGRRTTRLSGLWYDGGHRRGGSIRAFRAVHRSPEQGFAAGDRKFAKTWFHRRPRTAGRTHSQAAFRAEKLHRWYRQGIRREFCEAPGRARRHQPRKPAGIFDPAVLHGDHSEPNHSGRSGPVRRPEIPFGAGELSVHFALSLGTRGRRQDPGGPAKASDPFADPERRGKRNRLGETPGPPAPGAKSALQVQPRRRRERGRREFGQALEADDRPVFQVPHQQDGIVPEAPAGPRARGGHRRHGEHRRGEPDPGHQRAAAPPPGDERPREHPCHVGNEDDTRYLPERPGGRDGKRCRRQRCLGRRAGKAPRHEAGRRRSGDPADRRTAPRGCGTAAGGNRIGDSNGSRRSIGNTWIQSDAVDSSTQSGNRCLRNSDVSTATPNKTTTRMILLKHLFTLTGQLVLRKSRFPC